MTLSAAPIFTNDAVVLGILMILLAFVFVTSGKKTKGWSKFYTFFPPLLLCYFLPALLNWPGGLIASEWIGDDFYQFISNEFNISLSKDLSLIEVKNYLQDAGIKESSYKHLIQKSNLYFIASRYLLPASLILLCLSIDLKGIRNLGPKALIMFFAATFGIIIGGPIALMTTAYIFPDVVGATGDELWRGLSTIAGSWIGGGANQAAMKEVYEVADDLFGTMIVVDVVCANIWMGFLLAGANHSDKIDKSLKADNSAITDLKEKVASYRAGVEVNPNTTQLFILLALAFGGVGLSHALADVVTPFMNNFSATLNSWKLNSLMSGFFWLVVFATTIGVVLSFTKAKRVEGYGASKWGSVFIYVLVATIGMKMNLQEVFTNLGLFAIGITWMLVHVIILLIVAYIIKAPFFFVAVGSQANVGGAASAPVVASAFDVALAPVGVLMAVMGYALGTYGAIICAQLMQAVSG